MSGHAELIAELRAVESNGNDELDELAQRAADVIEKQQRRLDALCLVLGCNCEGDD